MQTLIATVISAIGPYGENMQILNHPKPAIIYKDTETSYTDLLKNISAIAGLLKKKPFKAVILSENRPEWIYAFYAVIKLNGISVPVDFLSSEDELLYILNDCEPDYIFCSNQTYDKAQKASKNAATNMQNNKNIT